MSDAMTAPKVRAIDAGAPMMELRGISRRFEKKLDLAGRIGAPVPEPFGERAWDEWVERTRVPRRGRAFVAVWRRPWMSLAADTYGASLLALLGIGNVYDDALDRYPEVDLDDVAEREPDLVVLDLQIGNMGGMATCLDLHLEAGAGRLPDVPVLMLLDRQADVFLARRSNADGWLVKPLDAFRLRRAVAALLDGQMYTEGMPEVAEPA